MTGVWDMAGLTEANVQFGGSLVVGIQGGE